MKKLLIALSLSIITISTINAQIRPQWLKSVPVPSNSTYSFIPITTESRNITEGRSDCLQMLATDRGLLNSVTVTQRTERTDTDDQMYKNGKLQEQFESKTLSVTTFDGKPIQLQAKIVDEFLDTKKGQFSTLYAVALTDNPRFDDIRVTTKYGFGAVALSIIPGVGQLYKGSTGKGLVFMGGVAATAAGGCVFLSQYNSYYSSYKSEISRDAKKADQYLNLAQNAQIGCYVCFGACAALYIYNLIDAAVAPGGTRVVPIVTANGGAGIAYTKTF